jgi:hypothetical protein
LFVDAQIGYCEHYSPSQVVRQFYQWYLQSDTNSIYHHEIYKYVDLYTVEKCRTHLERGILDSDYFTDSQDPDPAWVNSLDIQKTVKLDDSTDMVLLNFSKETKDTPWLAVFLHQEQGVFHITKVQSLNGYF